MKFVLIGVFVVTAVGVVIRQVWMSRRQKRNARQAAADITQMWLTYSVGPAQFPASLDLPDITPVERTWVCERFAMLAGHTHLLDDRCLAWTRQLAQAEQELMLAK